MVSTRRATRTTTGTYTETPRQERRLGDLFDLGPPAELLRRRPWLHVLVALLIALGAVNWAGSTAASFWLHDLDNRLLDAGAGTNATVASVEREQLATYRGVAYAEGVSEALAAYDAAALERTLSPVVANGGIPMVDLLDQQGRVAYAFRAEGAPAPQYRERRDITIVAQALNGQSDQYGDRFADLLTTKEGPLLATAGPVRRAGKVVGAVLVMTPLDQVIGLAANEHGAFVTAYSTDRGDPLATSLASRPRNLGTRLRSTLQNPDKLPYARRIEASGATQRMQVGALVARHRTIAWVGTSLPDRSHSLASKIMLIVALGAGLIALLVGAVVATWLGQSRRGRGWRGPSGADPLELPTTTGGRP
jgi:hypothetical protein